MIANRISINKLSNTIFTLKEMSYFFSKAYLRHKDDEKFENSKTMDFVWNSTLIWWVGLYISIYELRIEIAMIRLCSEHKHSYVYSLSKNEGQESMKFIMIVLVVL